MRKMNDLPKNIDIKDIKFEMTNEDYEELTRNYTKDIPKQCYIVGNVMGDFFVAAIKHGESNKGRQIWPIMDRIPLTNLLEWAVIEE